MSVRESRWFACCVCVRVHVSVRMSFVLTAHANVAVSRRPPTCEPALCCLHPSMPVFEPAAETFWQAFPVNSTSTCKRGRE